MLEAGHPHLECMIIIIIIIIIIIFIKSNIQCT